MSEKEKKTLHLIDVLVMLRNTYRFLMTKWLLIVVVGVTGGVAGIVYAWMQEPVYQADMSFVVEADKASTVSAYSSIAAQFGIDLGGGTNGIFEGDNIIELFKSRNLVQQTLLTKSGYGTNDYMMVHYLHNQKALKSDKIKSLPFDNVATKPERYRDSLLSVAYQDIVKTKLEVTRRDKKLSIISVSMKDTDELFAKRFVELLAQNAIRFYTDYKSKKSRQNVDILQRQTDSVKSLLFGGITQVATLSDINVSPLKQVQRAGVQKKQVDVQVSSALYTELLKNLELAKISARRETPFIQVIDMPQLPLQTKKLGRLKGGIIFGFLSGVCIVGFLLTRRYLKTIQLPE